MNALNSEYSQKVEVFLQDANNADDANRMLRYSNMALKIIDAYSTAIQKRKVDILGTTITTCYKKLANKKSMICRIVMDAQSLDTQYNMLSFSAHKLGGPQGIGALILRKNRYKYPPVKSVFYGGQQEHGIRPGTIPVALVAGCGKACELSKEEYIDNTQRCIQIKSLILQLLNESGLPFSINGEAKYSIANTLNVCIHGVSSEALMLATKSFCGVSNGSACTSKTYLPSYVLQAMGLSNEDIESSIRISWGRQTDPDELKASLTNMLHTATEMLY